MLYTFYPPSTMSFGVSIGDLIKLGKVAGRVYKSYPQSCTMKRLQTLTDYLQAAIVQATTSI